MSLRRCLVDWRTQFSAEVRRCRSRREFLDDAKPKVTHSLDQLAVRYPALLAQLGACLVLQKSFVLLPFAPIRDGLRPNFADESQRRHDTVP